MENIIRGSVERYYYLCGNLLYLLKFNLLKICTVNNIHYTRYVNI